MKQEKEKVRRVEFPLATIKIRLIRDATYSEKGCCSYKDKGYLVSVDKGNYATSIMVKNKKELIKFIKEHT